MSKVCFLIRSDGLYLSYLKSTIFLGLENWFWDGYYRTKEEFESVYKEYDKEQIIDED